MIAAAMTTASVTTANMTAALLPAEFRAAGTDLSVRRLVLGIIVKCCKLARTSSSLSPLKIGTLSFQLQAV